MSEYQPQTPKRFVDWTTDLVSKLFLLLSPEVNEWLLREGKYTTFRHGFCEYLRFFPVLDLISIGILTTMPQSLPMASRRLTNFYQPLVSFAADIKLIHSAFALPFVAMTVLYASAATDISNTKILLVVSAMIFARSFAMGFNRLVDRRFDSLNPRTAKRALPAGRLSVKNARFILVSLAIGFVANSFLLSQLCGFLSPFLLAVLALYSYLKRFTSLCHFYLGFCLALSPSACEIALLGTLSKHSILLGAGIIFWTAAFDIIYAHADRQFDKAMDLFSIPTLLGHRNSAVVCALSYILSLCFWILYARQLEFHDWFYVGLGLVSVVFLGQVVLFAAGFTNTPSRINLVFFWANASVSLLLLLVSILEFSGSRLL